MTYQQAKAALFAVMLVSFISTVGIALPFPILAPYFLDPTSSAGITQFGGFHPKLLLGVILALYPLGLLFGGVFIGALSDVYGRKKILNITLSLAAFSYLGTVWALLEESYLAFAIMRLLTGICEGNMSVARAIAVDLHPTIDRKRSLSLVFAATYAGWLVGPIIGGYLMPFGVEVSFAVAAAMVVGCLLVVFAGVEADGPTLVQPPLWTSLRANNSLGLLKDKSIRPLIVFHLIFSLALNTFYEYFPLWLVEAFGHGPQQIAWLSVTVSLSMIITSAWFVSKLANHVSDRYIILGAVLVLGVAMALLPFANPALCLLLFVVIGATIAAENGVFPAFMSATYGHYGQGRIMGLLTTNFCLANVIMALVGAVLALAGSEWVLWSSALLFFVAAAWMQWKIAPPVSN